MKKEDIEAMRKRNREEQKKFENLVKKLAPVIFLKKYKKVCVVSWDEVMLHELDPKKTKADLVEIDGDGKTIAFFYL